MIREILIIEDNERINNILAEKASSIGYIPVRTLNAREAILYLRNAPYVAALPEIELPDTNGIEVPEYIDGNNVKAPDPVTSEIRNIDIVIKCFESRAYGYVLKPFDVAHVKETVSETITNRTKKAETNDHQLLLEKQIRERPKRTINAPDINNPLQDAVLALVGFLEFRERGIGKHAGRVREYALHLGRLVGLDDEQLLQLSDGAFLHDIGKICIPDTILLKKGPLTPEEWEIMKQHPVTGYNIIAGIEHFANAAEVILTHHERYDGTGYPRGLTGAEIPVTTRVFSIVDTFDTVTSKRPYAPAKSIPYALHIIRENAGTQFDP